MTGSKRFVTADSYESVVEWYEGRLGRRGDLTGKSMQADTAVWSYEPSRSDDGIMIVVTRSGRGSAIDAATFRK